MRNKQNILLASVAALALLAGTGLASAQTGKKDNGAATQLNGAGTAGASNHAMTPGAGATGAAGANASTNLHAQSKVSNSAKGPGASMAQKGAPQQNQSAQNMKPGAGGKMNGMKMNRTAQGEHRRGHTMAERRRFHEHNRATAQKNERGNPSTAQQLESNKRLQGNTTIPMQSGNAAGPRGANLGNVQLSDQQRSTIRDTVIGARGAPRAGRVDFDVQVGTVVPRSGIRVIRVPETLVRIEPRWRGYDYFVYEDEVVIVNPRDMRIVAVVTV